MYTCGSRIDAYDGSVLGADESCEWDPQEIKDYLGTGFEFLIFHNQMEFDDQNYDEASV